MPVSVAAQGDKFYVTDNCETPDTMQATFQYPKFLMTYESRTCNPLPLFGLDRASARPSTAPKGRSSSIAAECRVIPNAKPSSRRRLGRRIATWRQMNVPHWKNFIECIKTREKPTSEIETCVRSSTTCLLGNLAMRHKTLLDWDEKNWTVKQEAVKPYLKARYRAALEAGSLATIAVGC